MQCNVCIYIYMHVLIDMHQSDRTSDSGRFLVRSKPSGPWFAPLMPSAWRATTRIACCCCGPICKCYRPSWRWSAPKWPRFGGGAWGGGWGLVGGPCLSKNRVPSHGIVSIFLTEEVIWIDLGAAYPIFRQSQVYEIHGRPKSWWREITPLGPVRHTHTDIYIYIYIHSGCQNYRTEPGVQKYGKIPYLCTPPGSDSARSREI